MLCLWLLTCLRTLRGESGLILSSCCHFWCIYYPFCCFECSRLLQTFPSLSMLAQIFLYTPPLVPNAVGMCWTGIFSQAALGVLSGVVEPSLHCSGFFCSWAVILSALVLPLLCLHSLYLCVVNGTKVGICPWFVLFFLLIIIGSRLTQVFAHMLSLVISLMDLGCFWWSWFWWSYLLVLGLLPSHSTISGHWSVTINHTDQRSSG